MALRQQREWLALREGFGQSLFGQSLFGQSLFGQALFGQALFGQALFGQRHLVTRDHQTGSIADRRADASQGFAQPDRDGQVGPNAHVQHAGR
jgi:hypothetical protein